LIILSPDAKVAQDERLFCFHGNCERIINVKQLAAGYEDYQQWLAGTKLEQQVSPEDYSVSNRGLRAGLMGTPEQVIDRMAEFEAAGVDLLLLQCSPQFEEMERFAESVINSPLHSSATDRPSPATLRAR
jgi:FMNH2-dependent dimethyl sulfone monooxygenase